MCLLSPCFVGAARPLCPLPTIFPGTFFLFSWIALGPDSLFFGIESSLLPNAPCGSGCEKMSLLIVTCVQEVVPYLGKEKQTNKKKRGFISPICIFYRCLCDKGEQAWASASRTQTLCSWLALTTYQQNWHFYKFSVTVDENAGAKVWILPVLLFVRCHGFTLMLILCLFQVPGVK